jgi:hypothetical protein
MPNEFETLTQIANRYPGARGGKRMNPSTLTRWILQGCPARTGQRVKLAATRVGGRWCVRPADLDAFFAALAGNVEATPAATPSTQDHKTADRAALASESLRKRGA